MSASAVAARSVSLSISNMDEEEQEEPQQLQKCEELTEDLVDDKHRVELDLDLDQRQLQRKKEVEDEEQMMLETTTTAAQQESEAESERLQVGAQLRAMAVSTTRTNAVARAHHDAAPSTATSTGTRSAGDDDVNGCKDRLKPFIRTCKKFESGSGSGDQDGMVSMEDGTDVAAKKRKTRRGKPKHRKLKPYSKQQPSYQQRLRCRASGRPNKAGRNPAAPYNTTQFLMEDRGLPDLDEKIAGTMLAPLTPHGDLNKPIAPSRTRDSSFSIDSDEEFFYSSPEDEEEFLSLEFSKEFSNVYEERLSALSKSQLIAEYIQLEAKIDGLTKRLRAKSSASASQQQQQSGSTGATATSEPSEPRDAELAKKLKQRVDELLQQNEQLRRENERLRQRQGNGSPMSSVDSESDSSDGSCNGSDCSDCSNHKASPGSSPVPASYHACREKSNRRKNTSVSSLASESDSTTNDSAASSSPKSTNVTTEATTTPTTNNGHASSYEIVNLPT